jgi:hypothetical protein
LLLSPSTFSTLNISGVLPTPAEPQTKMRANPCDSQKILFPSRLMHLYLDKSL